MRCAWSRLQHYGIQDGGTVMRFRDQREAAIAVLKGTVKGRGTSQTEREKDQEWQARRLYRANTTFPHPMPASRIGKGDNERPLNYNSPEYAGVGSVFSKGPRRRLRGTVPPHPQRQKFLEGLATRRFVNQIRKRDRQIGLESTTVDEAARVRADDE